MFGRKNEGISSNNKQQDSGSECGGDPKRWLFRKMMMGRKGEINKSKERRRRRSGSAISESTTSTTMSGGDQHEDIDEQEDLLSEAGTYVVENDKSKSTSISMTTSQISGISNLSSNNNKNNRTNQQCYDRFIFFY
jgi:hypothetical protein